MCSCTQPAAYCCRRRASPNWNAPAPRWNIAPLFYCYLLFNRYIMRARRIFFTRRRRREKENERRLLDLRRRFSAMAQFTFSLSTRVAPNGFIFWWTGPGAEWWFKTRGAAARALLRANAAYWQLGSLSENCSALATAPQLSFFLTLFEKKWIWRLHWMAIAGAHLLSRTLILPENDVQYGFEMVLFLKTFYLLLSKTQQKIN